MAIRRLFVRIFHLTSAATPSGSHFLLWSSLAPVSRPPSFSTPGLSHSSPLPRVRWHFRRENRRSGFPLSRLGPSPWRRWPATPALFHPSSPYCGSPLAAARDSFRPPPPAPTFANPPPETVPAVFPSLLPSNCRFGKAAAIRSCPRSIPGCELLPASTPHSSHSLQAPAVVPGLLKSCSSG